MDSKVKDFLSELYLDWVNNYITIDRMAEDYGMTKSDLITILFIACKVYEKEGEYGKC
jgi:hypothetical protein